MLCGAGTTGALRWSASDKQIQVCTDAVDGSHGWQGLALQTQVDAIEESVESFGLIKARYWQVKHGSVTVSHAPRVGQIRFKDSAGNVIPFVNSVGTHALSGNNCADSGWIWWHAGNYFSVDFGSAKAVFSVELYTVYGGGLRGSMVHTFYSTSSWDGGWTEAPNNSPFEFRTDSGCGWYNSGNLQ